MKSLQMIRYGHAETLVFKDLPTPTPQPDQVLVKVHYTALNPFDLKLISGMFEKDIPQQLPVTLGGDFSGEIVETGEKAIHFQKGDRVYGSGFSFAGGTGSMAEYVCVAEDKIARIPENCTFAQAAAIVTPGCAAQQAINRYLQVKPGQKILIQGGGGNVGSLATELALHIGAEVAVTVGPDDINRMKELGVDLIINYQLQPFEGIVHEFDGVLDTVGGDVLSRCYQTLKPGGTLVSLIETPDQALCRHFGIHGVFQSTQITTQTLTTLSFLLEEKIIHPLCFIEEKFQNAIEVYNRKFTHQNKDKIVFEIL